MDRKSRIIHVIVALFVALSFVRNASAAGQECFPQTGQCMDGKFADYWHAHGGLPINGYPISGLLQEDGRTVQYFERVRMEDHGNMVLLGHFGREILDGRPASQELKAAPPVSTGGRYYPQTGKYLDGEFMVFWDHNGGLAQFGYPITNATHEVTEGGERLWVQYFERARMELHGKQVLLGLFGRIIYDQKHGGGQSSPAPLPASNCKLDKVATFAEVNGAGPQRMEVGGGGVQHTDYYPDRGVNAVSYIVPIGEPGIWMGFGSIWEGNGPECQSFDWIADATRYAQGRLNNGHSGLVIDLRQGGAVVANVGNLSQAQINELLSRHRASQQGVGANPNPPSGQQPTPPPSGGSGGNCPAAQATVLQMGSHELRGPMIANLWSNKAGVNQAEKKYIIFANENPWKLNPVGGTVWQFAASCSEEQIKAEYAKNPLPPGTWQELHDQGVAH